ncbi:MAG: outer membrane protein transport protein, partial [Pseudomonadales bacterium]|nr:outer membrane protein transport protein [Pseudomonadales bacterium]
MRQSLACLIAGKCGFTLFILLMGLPLTAKAVLTDSLTIGNAKAIALGHAVTADPPGIDAIHFNPAGLVRLQGRKIHYKLVTSSFDIGMEFGDHAPEVEDYIRIWEESGSFLPGFFDDSIENSRSETEGAAVMLPFFGMHDLPVLLAPLGGMSYTPPGSKVTFATNVYSPLGAGFYRDEDDPGRYMGERLSIMSLAYLSPSLAYRLTDTFSVGFSLLVNYQALGVEMDTRAPHAGIVLSAYAREVIGCDEPGFDPEEAPLNFCGGVLSPFDSVGKITVEVEDPFSLSYNFGVLWEPYPWLSLGMVYQQGSKMDMKGKFKWESGDNWAAVIGPLAQSSAYQQGEDLLQLLGYEGLPSGQVTEEGEAAIPMKLPDHFAVGFSVQVTPSLKL